MLLERDAFYSMLGIAMRAGALTLGTDGVLTAISSGSAKFVLLDELASDNTKKNISDKATYYNAKFLVADATAEELGRAVGHSHTAAIAFTDINFVKAYEKSLS